MSKGTHTPPLTIDGTFVRGRWLLTATYASSRPNVAPHRIEGRDDGMVMGCTCNGFKNYGRCWHRDNLALDWFRARWADASLAALARRDADLRHWLALGPDAGDEAAARIELSVIGDAIAERTKEAAA